MKKIFTLMALLTCFMGVRAADWVEVYKIDYSSYNGFPFYVMGYVPEWFDGVMTDFGSNYGYVTLDNEDGETSDYIVTTQGGAQYYRVPREGAWHQYFIADGIPTIIDGSYKVKAMVKASEPVSVNVNMGWGWGDGQQMPGSVSIGTEWAEVEWEYSGIGGSSCNLVAQPGGFTGTIEWKYVIVEEYQKEQRPTVWQEWLTSDGQPVIVDGNPIPTYMGDAETPWSDPNVRFDDQTQNFLICAWSKEKGRNMNDDGGWDPFPSDIENVDGSNVFVCHGQPATTDGDASAWDNQFWIQSPKAWKSGDQIKIHFRYKASAPVSSTDTQIHYQNPSNYLIWHAIGNIAFTEEWQEFNGTMTMGDDMAGGWSIAFNLNTVVKDAVTFYFDDLSWQSMKLEEGYFVAGCNTIDGLEYNFDDAVQFVYDEDEALWVATIGEKGAYVNQIMISTVRGNDAAFKSNTLKPAGTIENNPENWMDYTASSLAKLNLPGSGIWKIYLDDAYKAMAFEMLEGVDITPIEINPNPTLVTINALERDFTEAEQEGGTGQPWDNQFWIVANRTLSAGETSVVQFKYKSAIPAKASTQAHSTPGNYLHWAAIGDVNFTEEWQDFDTTFTVASEANGMQSIAFNLSEIKDANTYELKDFIWKTEDGTESLIDQTGSKNFYVKILGGNPEQFVDDGINNVVIDNAIPTVTYNIAGQRVSKDYKGIVVTNGKKYIAK